MGTNNSKSHNINVSETSPSVQTSAQKTELEEKARATVGTNSIRCRYCRKEIEEVFVCKKCQEAYHEMDDFYCSPSCAEVLHNPLPHDAVLQSFVSEEKLQVALVEDDARLATLREHFENDRIPIGMQIVGWLASGSIGIVDDTGRLAAQVSTHGFVRQMAVATLQAAWKSSVIGLGVCTAFECGLYMYLWRTDQMSGKAFLVHCAEALAVNTLSFGSSLALGAVGGAALGSAGGPAGAAIGTVLGALIGGLIGYFAGRYTMKALRAWWAKRKVDGERKRMLEEALEELGMPKELANKPKEISARTAKQKFHALLRVHHPDRGGSSEKCLRIYWAYACVKAAIDGNGRSDTWQTLNDTERRRLMWDSDAWDEEDDTPGQVEKWFEDYSRYGGSIQTSLYACET